MTFDTANYLAQIAGKAARHDAPDDAPVPQPRPTDDRPASGPQTSQTGTLDDVSNPLLDPDAPLDVDAEAARLDAAADVWRKLGQPGRAATCREIASKLRYRGDYASQRQADFARSLILRASGGGFMPGIADIHSAMTASVKLLREWDLTRDADTLESIAASVLAYGDFASAKQRAFALSLVAKATDVD